MGIFEKRDPCLYLKNQTSLCSSVGYRAKHCCLQNRVGCVQVENKLQDRPDPPGQAGCNFSSWYQFLFKNKVSASATAFQQVVYVVSSQCFAFHSHEAYFSVSLYVLFLLWVEAIPMPQARLWEAAFAHLPSLTYSCPLCQGWGARGYLWPSSCLVSGNCFCWGQNVKAWTRQ